MSISILDLSATDSGLDIFLAFTKQSLASFRFPICTNNFPIDDQTEHWSINGVSRICSKTSITLS